jgi:hypothetical protein
MFPAHEQHLPTVGHGKHGIPCGILCRGSEMLRKRILFLCPLLDGIKR